MRLSEVTSQVAFVDKIVCCTTDPPHVPILTVLELLAFEENDPEMPLHGMMMVWSMMYPMREQNFARPK